MVPQPYKKNKKAIRWFFLYHGISCLLINKKFLFWNFWGWKMWYFLSQKVDGKMIFTDYWKVLVLNFSMMGNTVFFLSEEVDGKDDIYWLLKSSCFELFGGGKYGLFLSQEVDGKMIFAGYREVLVLNFSVMGNTIFFSAKRLMEILYLLGVFELSTIFQDLGNMFFRAVFRANFNLFNLVFVSLTLASW